MTGSTLTRLQRLRIPAVLLSLIFLVGLNSFCLGANNYTYNLQQTVNFSSTDLKFEKVDGYDFVRLADFGHMMDPGKPMLPAQYAKVALPEDMKAEGIRVISTETEEIKGEFILYPGQVSRKADNSESPPFTPPDKATYSSAGPYPSSPVQFIKENDLAGQPIANIAIYPVQYFPAQKRLVILRSISFEIYGNGGYVCGDYLPARTSSEIAKTYETLLKSGSLNPGAVRLSQGFNQNIITSLPGNGIPFDHAIITTTANAPYYANLVDWHTKRGLHDSVFTVSWIYANYQGQSNQDKIRNFVIDAHNTWGTAYFLIGGENESVPFGWRAYFGPGQDPGDQFYSDFDDDWSDEVYVGRITSEGQTEIERFINKLLTYEKMPPLENYLMNITLIGGIWHIDNSQNPPDTCDGAELKDLIWTWIPQRFNVSTVYQSDGEGDDDCFPLLNQGQHLVNQAGHSNNGYLGNCIWNDNVDLLQNTNRTSIIVSSGCSVNEMDNVGYECVGEHFVVDNSSKAGISFTGSTRTSWYHNPPTYGNTQTLDRLWWDGLLNYNIYKPGILLAKSKEQYPGDSLEMECHWIWNLLGEPEMPIWTETPTPLFVTHPDTFEEQHPFLVHVETDGSVPVEQAYVCLLKAGEVYQRGYTDSQGNITFTPAYSVYPSTVGTVYVTVTKRNLLPSETQAQAVRNNPPYVPNNPHPINGATMVDVNDHLSWSGGHPDGETTVYDLYFGTTNPPSLYIAGLSNTYCNLTLDLAHTYYWKVVSRDQSGYSIPSQIWSFSTVPLLPGSIYGLVNNMRTGGVVSGVAIQLVGTGLADTSEPVGYLFNRIQPGIFNISFSKYDYYDTTLYNISLAPGEEIQLNVEMREACFYVKGDANGDEVVNNQDVLFIVNYLKYRTPRPPDSCWNPGTQAWLFVAADANGDCSLSGIDAAFLTNYLSHSGPAPRNCPCCPPKGNGFLALPKEDLPSENPISPNSK